MSHDLYTALRDPFVDYSKNKIRYLLVIACVSLPMAGVLVGLNRACALLLARVLAISE